MPSFALLRMAAASLGQKREREPWAKRRGREGKYFATDQAFLARDEAAGGVKPDASSCVCRSSRGSVKEGTGGTSPPSCPQKALPFSMGSPKGSWGVLSPWQAHLLAPLFLCP